MRLGIFAKTFADIGALPVLAAIRASGYGCAQFNMACLGLPPMPDMIDDSLLGEIAEASRRTGVAIVAVSGTYNMIHPDPEVRAIGLARLRILIRSAALMGTQLVTLCTGTRDPIDQWRHHPGNASAEAWRDLLVEMEKALAFAEVHHVDLGIEPELGNVVSTPERARDLIDSLRSRRLRIVLDPANLFEVASAEERSAIIDRAVDLLADRMAIAHAKDRRADGGFAAAGNGIIDFSHFVGRLRRAGFDGPLVTHGLASEEASRVATFLRRILAANDAEAVT